ncbi:hypothetical protein ACFSUM_08865 [Virgibacillus siamensis]
MQNCRWLHIDMAGVMAGNEHGYYTEVASGFGTRQLVDYAADVTE